MASQITKSNPNPSPPCQSTILVRRMILPSGWHSLHQKAFIYTHRTAWFYDIIRHRSIEKHLHHSSSLCRSESQILPFPYHWSQLGYSLYICLPAFSLIPYTLDFKKLLLATKFQMGNLGKGIKLEHTLGNELPLDFNLGVFKPWNITGLYRITRLENKRADASGMW